MGQDLQSVMETIKYRGQVYKVYEGQVLASGNNNGVDEIDCLKFYEGTFFINCSAIVTTGGVVVTIQTKNPDPLITKYEDLVAFTSLAAIGSEKKGVNGNLGSRLSIKWDFTTTTSFTFSVYAVLKVV